MARLELADMAGGHLRRGVDSSLPCPAPLIRSLMQKRLNDMLEIYGSWETGIRAWPDNSYRSMPHWRRGHVQGSQRLITLRRPVGEKGPISGVQV
jgi:hypothetical protein